MKILPTLRKNLADERGSFSVEAILMFPLLVWAFMAMYVFFEGLRESNINLKATYTISDLLSRETDEINMNYLNGMNEVYAWLSRSATPVSMRVSVVRRDDANDRHVNVWSRGVAGKPDLTQAEIDANISQYVPIMADASTAIVVETWTTYEPIMDIGLTPTDLYNVVVTAPRFSDQLNFEGTGDGTGSTHNDGVDGDSDNPTSDTDPAGDGSS